MSIEDDNDEEFSEEHLDKVEQDLQKVFDEVNPQIKDLMSRAGELIAKAVLLSEEHGLPFCDDCTGYVGYIPETFTSKFPNIMDGDFWSELTEVYTPNDDCVGWMSSSDAC